MLEGWGRGGGAEVAEHTTTPDTPSRLAVPRVCRWSAGYPVRKSIQQDVLGTRFPQLSKGDPEEPVVGSPQRRRRPYRKVLPDRSRAARDRANQKLVEYIVKARGTEGHLRAILKNRKPSRWLKTFLNSGQYMTCVETYLEDEEQLDLVVKYLQGVYQETGSRTLARINGDRIRFILDVLLPEVSRVDGRAAVHSDGWGVCSRGPEPGPPATRGWGLVRGCHSPEVCPGGHGSVEPGARLGLPRVV